ncbi:MAG: amino acid ABC transporter permease [Cognatishimia sp.]
MYQFNFQPVFDAFDTLMLGAWFTIQMSSMAMLFGLVVSIFGAVGKTSGVRILNLIVDVYVEIIRNTPFLVQIYFIFFGLPALGVRMSPNQAALLALTVNFGAYGTEIIRAGIDSISRGQIEAAQAIGLSWLQVLRFVVIKPALRAVYPALTSQFIFLMLGSSVVSAISATDLTAAGNDLNSLTFASFEVYLVTTAIYLVMSVVFSAAFTIIGRSWFAYPVSR